MPIRMWNEPGGPVQWGEDWGFREKPMDMSEEEWQAYLAERKVGQTPSGRLAGYGGGVLDMTGGNLEAKERIMSRRSPFEGVSRERYQEAMNLADQGLSPDEMTARRLSRPWFESSTVAPTRLGRGESPTEIRGPEYTSTEMIEPSPYDLQRSAAFWKISGQPLEMRREEAGIEQALSEAEARRGLGEQYRAAAEQMREGEPVDQSKSLDAFNKLIEKAGILDDPRFAELSVEEKLKRIRQMWNEFIGYQEEPAPVPRIGRMGGMGGGASAESDVDELRSKGLI